MQLRELMYKRPKSLLAHIQFTILEYFQAIFGMAMLYPFTPWLVLVVVVSITKVQDLVLGFVEPSEVFLDGVTSFECVNHTIQLSVIHKPAESAFNPTVNVINEDIEVYLPQYWLMGDTTCRWSPSGHCHTLCSLEMTRWCNMIAVQCYYKLFSPDAELPERILLTQLHLLAFKFKSDIQIFRSILRCVKFIILVLIACGFCILTVWTQAHFIWFILNLGTVVDNPSPAPQSAKEWFLRTTFASLFVV